MNGQTLEVALYTVVGGSGKMGISLSYNIITGKLDICGTVQNNERSCALEEILSQIWHNFFTFLN